MNEQWAQAEQNFEQSRLDRHELYPRPSTGEPLTLRQYLMEEVNPRALELRARGERDFETDIMNNYAAYLEDRAANRGRQTLDNGIRFRDLETKLQYMSAALDMIEHFATLHHQLKTEEARVQRMKRLKKASYLGYLAKREING